MKPDKDVKNALYGMSFDIEYKDTPTDWMHIPGPYIVILNGKYGGEIEYSFDLDSIDYEISNHLVRYVCCGTQPVTIQDMIDADWWVFNMDASTLEHPPTDSMPIAIHSLQYMDEDNVYDAPPRQILQINQLIQERLNRNDSCSLH